MRSAQLQLAAETARPCGAPVPAIGATGKRFQLTVDGPARLREIIGGAECAPTAAAARCRRRIRFQLELLRPPGPGGRGYRAASRCPPGGSRSQRCTSSIVEAALDADIVDRAAQVQPRGDGAVHVAGLALQQGGDLAQAGAVELQIEIHALRRHEPAALQGERSEALRRAVGARRLAGDRRRSTPRRRAREARCRDPSPSGRRPIWCRRI